MAKYAEGTKVPVEKTKGEIEQLVTKYGARGYINGWADNRAMIGFEMNSLRVQFTLPLPSITDRAVSHTVGGAKRPLGQAQVVLAQHHRERWRAFLLVIKAKLEAVESGIRTFEQEFLNDIVTGNGMTIGAMIQPKLLEVAETGELPRLDVVAVRNLPPLLPGPRD